jgi:hypothetical protein
MKYFACLEPDTFDNFNEKNLIKILLDKELFEERVREKGKVKNGKIDSSTVETYIAITPTQDLKNEFYSYILAVYNSTITEIKHKFYEDFNEEIYGLELDNQRTIALKHFKEIYKDISLKDITFINEKVSTNGIKHSYNFEKIKMLYGQQRAHKNNLALTDTLEHYLTGNQTFFEENNIVEQYQIIEDLLLFEIWRQVLVELNDLFGFEEDYYFTNRNNNRIKFNEYKHIFKSLESYQFTDRKIKSFEKDKKAHIESLYEMLITNKLIIDQRLIFISFIKEEYKFELSKIISYLKKKNFIHDERVVLFNEEWQELTSKID